MLCWCVPSAAHRAQHESNRPRVIILCSFVSRCEAHVQSTCTILTDLCLLLMFLMFVWVLFFSPHFGSKHSNATMEARLGSFMYSQWDVMPASSTVPVLWRSLVSSLELPKTRYGSPKDGSFFIGLQKVGLRLELRGGMFTFTDALCSKSRSESSKEQFSSGERCKVSSNSSFIFRAQDSEFSLMYQLFL